MTLPSGDKNVVVIGGGLAGLSAAVELAEAGARVTILESRPWLGGATFSFARRGLTIDNGQHMFLRCCTAYRDLLAKLGMTAAAPVQEALELTVMGPGGQATLRRSGLPAPLHLARSLARYRLLSVPERMKVAVAMVALQFTEFRDGGEGSFEDWLDRRFQPLPARRLFWDLLATTGLNLTGGQADLRLTADAIRVATLSGRDSSDIGLPAVPLSRLHGGAATELLTRHGAVVRLGIRALSVQAAPAGGYLVRLGADGAADGPRAEAGSSLLTADAVVLAVPAWEAAEIAPAELAADAARWAALDSSPIVSVHVIYGSPVTRLPFAAIVGRQVLWVVDKTVPSGLHSGQYLAVSVPAADDYVNASTSGLREQFLPLLARYFPAAATAPVEDFFVTRERRATVRYLPGTPELRPRQPAGMPGLALAGAWTDTGWPDTMEGAVRSGRAAAGKILADLTAGQLASVTVTEPRSGAGPAPRGPAVAARDATVPRAAGEVPVRATVPAPRGGPAIGPAPRPDRGADLRPGLPLPAPKADETAQGAPEPGDPAALASVVPDRGVPEPGRAEPDGGGPGAREPGAPEPAAAAPGESGEREPAEPGPAEQGKDERQAAASDAGKPGSGGAAIGPRAASGPESVELLPEEPKAVQLELDEPKPPPSAPRQPQASQSRAASARRR
jgi:squalene-associated FAD-dependent desaturase